MVGLSIVLLTAASAVECRAYEAGQRHAEPLSKDFAEACALTFEVPSEIEVVLVMKEPQDSEQCVLGLNKKGVKRRPPEKATGDGYRELVDFVLEVKDVPVAQRLSEFGFVRAPEPAGTVRYVMQPLTESAKQSGYLDKKLRSFKVVEKADERLYVAEMIVLRRDASHGGILRQRRLDVLWGNGDISVGAILWCAASKPRDCDFDDGIRRIFSTMTRY